METKEALADIRKRNGLTQEEMAAEVFVTRQAVSRWETGDTTPSVDTLKIMSKRFGVSINELLGQRVPPECQSCAMPLADADDFGTEADGGISSVYCSHCYRNGGFTSNRSLEEMVESNLKHLEEFNKETGSSFSEDEARTVLKAHLATLKRWKASGGCC